MTTTKQYEPGTEAWWRNLPKQRREQHTLAAIRLWEKWIAAFDRGVQPNSVEAQRLAAEQYAWVSETRGNRAPTADEFRALGETYVADEGFAANVGGFENARFVRDAMNTYAKREL